MRIFNKNYYYLLIIIATNIENIKVENIEQQLFSQAVKYVNIFNVVYILKVKK